MMSSLHHDDEIDPESGTQRKPSIITFYNSTKSGVDVVDKLSRTYDVSRNSKRWPLTLFFSLLNHANINSFIVHMFNNESSKKKKRQSSCSSRKRVHQILDEEVPGPPQKQPRKSQRCSFCPRNKDRKTLNGCFKCNVAICKEHANLMCQKCTDLDNG
ncbi:unnamed protein product [Parnassius mnemosyne]|uniref:PiggyBac transposable element-derived protein domain-containing protein n=1 Tax=Parnassius mnemosyne TaxID=213953 RepID=A0AAV1KZ30_9NEOP